MLVGRKPVFEALVRAFTSADGEELPAVVTLDEQQMAGEQIKRVLSRGTLDEQARGYACSQRTAPVMTGTGWSAA